MRPRRVRALAPTSILALGFILAGDGANAAPERHVTVPISYEPNVGQADPSVEFITRGGGLTLFLTSNDIVLGYAEDASPATASSAESPKRHPRPGSRTQREATQHKAVHMKVKGGNLAGRAVGVEELPGKTHYLIGNDPTKWRTNIPRYARVEYQDVYPGVNLVFHGTEAGVEYDFVVKPGADPGAVQLEFEGMQDAQVTPEGDLVLKTGKGAIRHQRPRVYQEHAGSKQAVAGRYVLGAGKREVRFEVGPHDKTRHLVIDPTLSYTQTFGGSGRETTWAIAADTVGNAYITGETFSLDFPVTAGVVQPGPKTRYGTAFVTKLDPSGVIVYSTYLGGSLGEAGFGIAVDPFGNAYVTGTTSSTDFPTPNGYQTSCPGCFVEGAFVAKLSADGSTLLYGTFLSGSGDAVYWPDEIGFAIAADAAGKAYVTGLTSSPDFPVTQATAYSPVKLSGVGSTPYVTILDTNLTGSASLYYSTFLKGDNNNVGEGDGIAVDSSGAVYVAGTTYATNFPAVNAYQTTLKGGPRFFATNTFVAKLSPALGQAGLLYSTYLGGEGTDQALSLAVDGAGNAYVGGRTSSLLFPVKNAAQPTPLGGFVAKLNTLLSGEDSLVYSTYMSGPANVVADGSGDAIVIAPGPASGQLTYSKLGPSGALLSSSVVSLSVSIQRLFPVNSTIAIDPAGDVFYAAMTNPASGAPDVIVLKFQGEAAKLTIVPTVCASAPATVVSQPNAFTCSPGTTRWKPQRDKDNTKPIRVHFSGPSDLVTAKLIVTGPDVSAGTLPLPADYQPCTGPTPSPAGQQPCTVPFDPKVKDNEGNYLLVWNGPWTMKDAKGNELPVPRGNYKLVVSGTQKDSATEIKSALYDKVSLVEVAGIKFTQADGGARLATNADGDIAAFPDAIGPGQDYRRNVRVEVTTAPAVDPPPVDLFVNFAVIDVDDPSASTAPIDDDQGTATNPVTTSADNRGEVAPTPPAAAVDAHGFTSALFAVSTVQGDNYRIVASTSPTWLADLCGVISSDHGEVQHGPCYPAGKGSALTLDEGPQLSKMLTVWRTLHLELNYLDSSRITQNSLDVGGTSTKLEPQKLTDSKAPFKVPADLFPNKDDKNCDHCNNNDWRGGDLWPKDPCPPAGCPDGTGSFKVTENKGDFVKVAITDKLTGTATKGDRYRLADDYWTDLSQPPPLSLTRKALARAYIDVQILSGDPNQPVYNHHPVRNFRRNLEFKQLMELGKDPGDHVQNSPQFWSVQFVNAFDSGVQTDDDPDGEKYEGPGGGAVTSEEAIVGQTFGVGSRPYPGDRTQPIAAIYSETARDYHEWKKCSASVTDMLDQASAHEIIAHTIGLGSSPNTVTNEEDALVLNCAGAPAATYLNDCQVFKLRSNVTVPYLTFANTPAGAPCSNGGNN